MLVMKGIQIYPMASAIKLRVTSTWACSTKVVCCCALSPMQFSSHTLKVVRDHTGKVRHPSSPDIFCDHDIFCDTVSTEKMVQF